MAQFFHPKGKLLLTNKIKIMARENLRNLRDLLEHQLQELFSAEDQELNFYSKIIDNTSNNELRETFQRVHDETEEQLKRLDDTCQRLKINPKGERCRAMEGLIREAGELLDKNQEPQVRDAALIADVQRIKHYEMAGYGAACSYLLILGNEEEAHILHRSLEEIKNADQRLKKLAEDTINERAQV